MKRFFRPVSGRPDGPVSAPAAPPPVPAAPPPPRWNPPHQTPRPLFQTQNRPLSPSPRRLAAIRATTARPRCSAVSGTAPPSPSPAARKPRPPSRPIWTRSPGRSKKPPEEYYREAAALYQQDRQNPEVSYYTSYYHALGITTARCDSAIISLVLDEANYTGGAHGFDYRYARNYDAATGQVLTLADLGTASETRPGTPSSASSTRSTKQTACSSTGSTPPT